ncbi:methylated-DNA--[protein]-cysteine S-methyltransferase [Tomitella fengzijianii]|uniref:Methylated-DNA--protein-cysteine methyltransferase n=1 Tax=Tomitella fengzijianii TaxID=2597660 RepID=A0A516WZA8_9ACTN|nr:methylated-DNA--[protein]-cysteine S-methyltransferase [Tomitella fengzijianii]
MNSTTKPTPSGPRGREAAAGHPRDARRTDPVDTLALLRAAAPVGEHSLVEELFTRILSGADREGLIDVAYRTMDSPLGELLIAATPSGVVRVAFGVQGHDAVLDDLATRVSPRVLRMPWRLDDVATEIDEYFRGVRAAFTVPVDLRLAHGFQRAVLEHLPQIPRGATAGYAQIAQAAGSSGAARAVGTACSRNPLPILLPCHRVTRSDGSLGGYIAGPAAKKYLLDLEAARRPTGTAAPEPPARGTSAPAAMSTRRTGAAHGGLEEA